MIASYVAAISAELNLASPKVHATIELLSKGNTVPFIARYRKETTGSLDEVAITSIRDRLKQLLELDQRRAAVFKSLEEQNKLTPELKEKIAAAATMAVLEDIYLPFRPKKRTKAIIAREKGLEPLAEMIFKQDDALDPVSEAKKFVNAEKNVVTPEEALAGARDIIAEWINEHPTARAKLRSLFEAKGEFISQVIRNKEKEGSKFQDYFDWREPVKTAPSHRILAMRRGEKEGFLLLRVLPPEEDAVSLLKNLFIKNNSACAQQVQAAIADCYKRLLSLSMETEIRLVTKDRADREAIKVFSDNLRQLLMAPALGQKNVLAIDPGFRTGCKVVCLDRQGKLLRNETIYPTESDRGREEAGRTVLNLCKEFQVECIAVGNGTAGRETEEFVRGLGLSKSIPIVMVNESGASIYSASEVAREEFASYDVTVRGAVSIGRRLMDPLAELVKIDPKSIGVGQYQHDVDQELLKESLDDAVMSCVNQVGVEVNTASKQLLMYVAGIGPARAQALIEQRNQQGPFLSREQFHKVPGLGTKAFEQAAGFLRIRDAENLLDASAVHPESYGVVEAMARDAGCSMKDLMKNENLRRQIKLEKYVNDRIGLPTLEDIYAELAKPGRDPREQFEIFSFKEGVSKPQDLKPGMKLPGIVTNVTAFGAFVDIGVHLDGLVHISELSDKYVKNPHDVVKVQQKVTATVLEVDLERNRIALSLRSNRK
ncbi:MAG: RNA-binding transcriptional accessory protein [Omnitrophica WOR_2 bacterium RIFCSPHIGHO2_01_FULL_48_9]|nr:MAG: RNA-binding transcriptional accessory protein [Omnitrophica WOR_2 bacterium RIFCSPHIGHO2_01_FULL_48_9]